MAQITKREFFAKYASARCRRDITIAAASSYLGMAAALGYWTIAGDGSFALIAAPFFVLTLWVQFTKSRVCAVLILLGAFAGSVAITLESGRVFGWWLTAVWIFAVRSVFRLHKEYTDFIHGGLRGEAGAGFGALPPLAEPRGAARNAAAPFDARGTEGACKAAKRVNTRRLFITVLPFIGMFFGLCLIWLSISPGFLRFFVEEARSPEALLLVYRDWYIVVIAAVAAAVLLSAACVAVSVRRGLITAHSVQIMILALAFPILLGGYMIMRENVLSLLVRANEDLSQIESGRLSEVTVWLSPKSRPARLPGPYSSGQPEPVTRYGGISHETGGKWVHFYVPDCLKFSLDKNAPYNENRSIAWNEKHARRYFIRYTKNFGLVVSVEHVGRQLGRGDSAL